MKDEGFKCKFTYRAGCRKKNIRKTQAEEEKSGESYISNVVKVPKKKASSQNVQSTTGFTKSQFKKSKDHESAISVNYNSGDVVDRTKFSTSYREFDTEVDTDSKAIFEKHMELTKNQLTSDGMYHGLAAYQTYREIKDTIKGNASSVAVRQGPVRASQNIRVTTRWDYHPEICKDYKETGFCGFGDSCKFIHDRSDYKSGWEIDKEIEENKKKIDYEALVIHSSEEDTEMDSLHCPICKNRLTCPVKAKCNHCFCEKCALENYQKDSKCYVCSAQTYGIFNPAKNIQSKLEEFEKKLKEMETSGDSDFDTHDLENVGTNEIDIVNECLDMSTPSDDEESSKLSENM